MRPKTYFQAYQGSVSHLTFQPEHYGDAGVRSQLGVGMPLLEAYWLINKWNKENGPHGYSYWMEI